ncbi:MAG: S1 family peptidase [Acidimicrobiia bacterium]
MPTRLAIFAIALGLAFSGGSPVVAQDDGNQSLSCDDQAHQVVAASKSSESGFTHQSPTHVEVCGFHLPIAEVEDLLALGHEKGLGFREVADRYGWQGDFGEKVSVLRASFPDSYAGATFSPDGGSWVAFRAGAPREAIDLLASVPVAIIEGRGFSEAEINNILVAAFMEVSNLPGVVSSAGGYDQVTGRITIELVTDNPDVLANTDLWQSSNPAITLEVVVLDKPRWGPTNHIKGGGLMDTAHGSCTWGFSVRNAAGLRGVSTAHHCASVKNSNDPINQATYSDHGGGNQVVLALRGRAAGVHGDIAWYAHSTHPSTNVFYFNHNQTRQQLATAQPTVGQTLWKYGRTTGRASEKVYRLNECVSYSGYPQYCGLTAMHRNITQGGDSGGPWYFGNTAYGMTSGYKWIWFFNRSLFTPVVPNLSNGLGVNVMTAP